MSVSAPLTWPEGWERHSGHRDGEGRFRSSYGHELSLSKVVDQLWDELDKLGATDATLSMNINPSRALSRQRRADDPGVALYFRRREQAYVMAQDRFATVAANVRSLTLALAGIRQTERHGGAQIADRVFQGFTGVPATVEERAPDAEEWWEILGVSRSSPLNAIRGAWKQQTSDAQRAGDMERAQRLNAAWDAAQRDRKSA